MENITNSSPAKNKNQSENKNRPQNNNVRRTSDNNVRNRKGAYNFNRNNDDGTGEGWNRGKIFQKRSNNNQDNNTNSEGVKWMLPNN